ncbi:MAG: isoprenylcysteine carboxylmethyltransferase family protein [Acidobacteriaceae bacterium]
MQATGFEFRYRMAIHAVIYLLGFTAPWLFLKSVAGAPGFTTSSTWLVLSSSIARRGWLQFDAATITLLALALLLTGLGAWLRVWGSAYVGVGVVKSPTMHGETLLADGPYRRTRNPLYLGTLLHTFGITILMPPSGAVFSVVLLWIFEVRLALAEEPFLAARFGQAYLDYKKAVPRFLPAPTPQIAAAGARPHWMQAMLGEIYFVAVFVVLAVFGWDFNAQPLRQGVIISVGLWLIVRAFLPKAPQDSAVAA